MTKIYNPKTKKFIDSESRQFNNTIAKLNNEFDLVDNILVPKNKTLYGYSQKKIRWEKLDNKINKIYTKDDNDTIKMKDDLVYGIRGRIIKKNSKVFNNLIRQGYQLDTDRLIKPTQLTVADANREDFINAVTFNPTPYKFILDGEDSDGNRLFYIVRFISNQYAIEEFIRLSNSGEYTFDVYFIYQNDYIEYGPAYNSTTSMNCVINCVETHFKQNKYKLPVKVTWDELYKKYNDGFMESDYEELRDIIKCNIKVNENNNQHEYYNTKWEKKKILKLVYKNNHVEIDESKEELVNEIIKINNKCNCLDNLKFGEFEHTCDTLENVFNNESINNIEKVFLQGKKIIGYKTVDNKNYQNQFDIIELKDNELSYMTYLRKNIKKYFTNEVSPIKDELNIIQQVTKNAIFYTKQNNIDSYKLDITKAYDNFKELPTDLLYKINTTEFIDRMGYSLITYNDPITKLENTAWVFNEFIKQILIKYNIKFTITQGMYSSNTTILNIQQFYEDNKEIYKCDKRIFHKIIGSWQVYKFNDNKVTDDLSISNKYGGFEIREGLYIYDNNKEYTKTTNYYPHIVGAIHAYTNIKIYDVILKYNLEPIKIWVDGITLEKSIINKFTNWEKINNKRYKSTIDGFHIEESKKNDDEVILTSKHDKLENIKANYIIEFSKYKSMVLDELIELNKKNDFIIELPKDKISVIAGEGGTGKTGLIKTLEHIYKTTILTPTNMVKKHYKKAYTVYSFINPKLYKIKINGILLIDEYSMVSQEELNKLIEMYNPIKVIIFGDLIQLPSIYGTPITKYNIEYLTINHRAKDDPILQKCLTYTRTAKDGYITYLKNRKIKMEDAVIQDSMILSTTNSDVDKINKLGLSLNTNKQIPDSELKINTPIIITTNSLEKETNLVNNDYGFISNFNENEIILNINDELINVNIKHLKHIKPAYSLTYHKVQGLTVTKKVILNLNKITVLNRDGKDIVRNLLYVGVSRVKRYEQLYILDN